MNDTLCEHIAELAKLNIPDDEKQNILNNMNDMVIFASKLTDAALLCENISKPSPANNVLRDDIPESNFCRSTLIAASKSVHEGYITVPKVIEG